ncbi:uncharacterized protein TEOVI_000280300 [Trypanosoma equiperdum]|uniref:Uncharacterized protein n=3 Tax=Trypanozoon TaxID=39700 RepID=D0A5V5_TRYB9|nr:hypothetical protein, conserved [Trypanosoma brucei gambiense DAL972]RHW67833.1 hypothetical protein DPX39_110022400 [Trypanosoma brucei equiperdum]CBH17056.1 hypothetical protein, conserved [Trypanosoma brucei gambiense DAL972]SCU71223.1 hypothetical protein, conserved [Trypanosoma equiperdum]|eukprot:XP_011779320.1 hypothetical protein, conserved [Trypanosoma brucei gambiense DAL972]
MWAQQLSLQKQTTKISPADKDAQALITANVFIEGNRMRVLKSMEQYQAVADSAYWNYGYMGGSMVTTMAICLSLSGRLPLLQRYASWISLAGGYFGGKAALGIHNARNLSHVVNTIDSAIVETRKMDEQYNFKIPDYAREVEALQRRKFELLPTSAEAIEARKNDLNNMPLDEKVDALVEAYEKRRQAVGKK